MNLKKAFLSACVAYGVLASLNVQAQTTPGVIIMRKPMSSLPGQPVVGPVNKWVLSDWYLDKQACGATTQTRLAGCVDRKGNPVPDEMCKEPLPPLTRPATDYSACTYQWNAVPGEWNSTCSTSATRPVTVTCVREDGVPSDEVNCQGTRPQDTETGSVDGGCSYQWSIGEWDSWNNSCSASATRNRTVQCIRSDGGVALSSQCEGTQPVATEVGPNYSGCGYSWATGNWSTPPASCSNEVEITRSIECKRSDGTTVENTLCDQATAPETTKKVEDYSGCTYDWEVGAYGNWSSTCSANASRTRPVNCVRTDGQAATPEDCTTTAPEKTETAAVYDGCTFAWQTSEWVIPNSCAAGQFKTRNVTCQRSDGSLVDPSSCDQSTRPADTEALPDYGKCTYAWVPTYGSWSSTCSNNSTRTVTSTCIRQDGQTVADSLCEAGAKPAPTQTVENYSGCSYTWSEGVWEEWVGHCTPASTRTREVTCIRQDGVTVDGGMCDGTTKPATKETREDYSQCGYTWSVGQWSAPTSTCSANATITRTVTCTRNVTNESVADSFCTDVKPISSDTVSNYTGCTYTWDLGQWGPYNSTCSNNATRTRTVQCRRSDSTIVGNEFCPTPTPSTTDVPTKVVTDCGGSLVNGNFEAGSLSGWSVDRSKATAEFPSIKTDTVHGGTYSLGYPGSILPNSWAYQTFQTKAGVSYNLSGWGFAFGSNAPIVSILNAGGTEVLKISWANGAGNPYWDQKSGTFTGDGGTYMLKTWNNGSSTLTRLDDLILTVQSAP